MPKRNLKKKYKKKYKTKNKGGTWWKKKSSKTRVEKKKLSEADKKKLEGQIAEITAQMTPMVQALKKSVRAEANRRPKPLASFALDESIYAKDYSNIHSHPATARRSRDWRRHGSVPRPHHNSPNRPTQIVKKTPSKIPTQSTKKPPLPAPLPRRTPAKNKLTLEELYEQKTALENAAVEEDNTLRIPSKKLTQHARKAFKKAESTRVPKTVLRIPSKIPTQHRDFSSHINRKHAKKTLRSVARSAKRVPETSLRIASELPSADIPDISFGDIGDAFSGISNFFQ